MVSSGGESETEAHLAVVLSEPLDKAVSVAYGVSGGTARGAAIDYSLLTGILFLGSGETSTSILLTVVDDLMNELDETVEVSLTAPFNADLGVRSVHTYTILDDDPAPGLAVVDGSAVEGDGLAEVTVEMTGLSQSDVTVVYSTADVTALVGLDYASTTGLLTWSAGETDPRTLTVPVMDDAIDEAEETLLVMLSGATNATTTDAEGVLTITDDDPAPTVAFAQAAGDGYESSTPVGLVVTLNQASGQVVSVEYEISGGTATGGGVDHTLDAGTLVFQPGETSTSISLAVVDDLIDESDETIEVNLTQASNAVLSVPLTHSYTILDDDPTPGLAVVDGGAVEGDGLVEVTVEMTGLSQSDVTVIYSTADVTTLAGLDYASTTGLLTWTAGETGPRTLTVPVMDDAIDEAEETLLVVLSGATNATATDAEGVLTITDDDPAPTVVFALAAGDDYESSTPVGLVVTLSEASGQVVSVEYEISGGTATGGGVDYTLDTSVLVFQPGETSTSILLTVVDDLVDEPDETVEVSLTQASNAILSAPLTHSFTIRDND